MKYYKLFLSILLILIIAVLIYTHTKDKFTDRLVFAYSQPTINPELIKDTIVNNIILNEYQGAPSTSVSSTNLPMCDRKVCLTNLTVSSVYPQE